MVSKIKYLMFIIATIVLLSCVQNKREADMELTDGIIVNDFEDLFQKYNDTFVLSCNELLLMMADMEKIYRVTIKKAEKGNKRAKSDLFDFDIYKTKFDS